MELMCDFIDCHAKGYKAPKAFALAFYKPFTEIFPKGRPLCRVHLSMARYAHAPDFHFTLIKETPIDEESSIWESSIWD